jgi:hypothetical protein
MANVRPNTEHIHRVLAALFGARKGTVVELRALDTNCGVQSGYFDDLDRLADAAAALSGKGSGVYVTLNPCVKDLLARAHNRVKPYARVTTGDAEILERRWMPIDIDPVRPAGISSTDQEHQLAIDLAFRISDVLKSEGWPEPIVADSGNGAYLLYHIAEPAADASLIKDVLASMSLRWNSDQVGIDASVYNPGRMVKVFGTLAAKGDSLADRPHRLSRIIQIPEDVRPVPHALLEAMRSYTDVIASLRDAEHGGANTSFDLESWVEAYAQDAEGPVPWQGTPGARLWKFKNCPWRESDKDSAYLIQFPNGAITAGCLHATCPGSRTTGNHWTDLRTMREPVSANRNASGKPEAKLGESDSDGTHPIFALSNTQQRERMHICASVLHSANQPPTIFKRSGRLVQVQSDSEGHTRTLLLTKERLSNVLSAQADFVIKKGTNTRPTQPSSRDLAEFLEYGHWNVPVLDSITEAPIRRPDGTILDQPGYDPITRLYYQPDPSLALPPIPDEPTEQEVEAARDRLLDVIGDFPFAGESDAAAVGYCNARSASQANALAALMTPILRPAISGHIPIAAIDAPQQGSGKGLLCDVISLIATGRRAELIGKLRNEEEIAKTLTSMLLAGTSIITIDNIDGNFDSPQLATFTTSTLWKQRLLGSNEMVDLPQKACVILNGNNLSFSGDLSRRCYWIRLDAHLARPWQRKAETFRHPKLADWVLGNRGALVAAILILARHWVVSGRPKANIPAMGTFDAWAEMLGGILMAAGIDGFLSNVDAMYDRVDPDTQSWGSFLATWFNVFRDGPVTVKGFSQRLTLSEGSEACALVDVLPQEISEALERCKSPSHAIGKILSAHQDRTYPNGCRLEKAGTDSRSGVANWRVVQVEG